MRKTNYLNNKDILAEIHKSKSSFCSYVDKDYHQFDIILPDIEKRLEAFVRIGHAMLVFPGGVGTAEEIFFTLGVLMHPNNKNIPFQLIFTGPESSRDYFAEIDSFINNTLGNSAKKYYKLMFINQSS